MIDFDDILTEVGSFGRYQKIVLMLVLFPATMPCGFMAWNQMFMSGTPRSYWCRLPVGNNSLNQSEIWSILPKTVDYEGNKVFDKCQMYDVNYSDPSVIEQLLANLNRTPPISTVSCQYGWEYDHTDWASTIVTEWDLVCAKELYVTIAYTINGCGSIVSMILLGFLADRYGRKVSYFTSYWIMMVFSVATAFAPTYAWFCVFRFIVGFGPGWTYTIPVMISMELMGPQPRALMSVIVSAYYTFTFLCVGGISYLLNSWRPYALASSLPLLFIALYWWVMPESPRWLLGQKRYEELAGFFRRVAKTNKKSLEPIFDRSLPELLETIDKHGQAADDKGDRKYSVLDLFRTYNLRKKTLILIFVNVCNLGVYIGLTFYGPSINENPHWNFFLSGLAEMPGYLFTTIMCNRLGRRFTLVLTMAMAGISGLVAAAIPSSSSAVIMGLVFLSKFFISIAFVLSELLEDEVFPTVVRGEGHSITAFVSNLLTLGVPFIVFLGYQYMVLPLIIFGTVCIMAAGSSLFLPETANTDLPQTLEDGELVGKDMTWAQIFSFRLPAKRPPLNVIAAAELSPLQELTPKMKEVFEMMATDKHSMKKGDAEHRNHDSDQE